MSDTDDKLMIACAAYVVMNSVVKKNQKRKFKKIADFGLMKFLKTVFAIVEQTYLMI
jgi:hypothetical protein